jgi:hypothetical protein
MLTITDSNSSFVVNERKAIDLELKLNVTYYGRPWRNIGDVLYKFGTGSTSPEETLVVSKEQLDFLIFLNSKESWQVCRDLK